MLRETVKAYAGCVERNTRVPLTQPQFDALTSLTYNIGQGGYVASSVRRVLNRGQYAGVCAELRKYVKGTDGKVYPGLVRRREAECALFNAEEEGDMWERFNARSAHPPFNGGEFAPGEYDFHFGGDFPDIKTKLPVKAIDLEVHIEASTLGTFVVRDHNRNYAGRLNRYVPEGIVRVVPDAEGDACFSVTGYPVKVRLVGAVGVLR